MTTIGFRFEDERASIMKPRRSLLHKLNERHVTLISHMRSKKVDQPPQLAEEQNDVSWASSLSSRKKVSLDTTITSGPNTERNSRLNDSSHDGAHEDLESPPSEIDTTQDSEFGLPFQYSSTPKDREGRWNVVQGMQSFVLWKHASSKAALTRPFHISPPCTPQIWHSMASSRAASGEMSDEQIEEWLERPEDAEVHRFRKFSGGTANPKAESRDKKNHLGNLDGNGPYKEEKDGPTLLETQRASDTSATCCDAGGCELIEGMTVPTSDFSQNDGSVQDDAQKFVSLPKKLLQEIAFLPSTNSTQEFRPSCMRIYDIEYNTRTAHQSLSLPALVST